MKSINNKPINSMVVELLQDLNAIEAIHPELKKKVVKITPTKIDFGFYLICKN